MRVVFDSNIFISALAIPGGAAEEALEAAIAGAFDLVLSRPIIHEVLEVLARKFDRDLEELSRTAVFLSGLGDVVTPRRKVRVLRDDPDNRILECASEGGSELIVTGDREMLALAEWEGIRIASLREFLDLLGALPVAHSPAASYEAR